VIDRGNGYLQLIPENTLAILLNCGTQIGESIGITVKQFRRAFMNYHLHVEGMSRDKIARVSGHSVDVNKLIYSTIDSNEAIKNTIYDKNVIDKKSECDCER
jgi:hypothetical protein